MATTGKRHSVWRTKGSAAGLAFGVLAGFLYVGAAQAADGVSDSAQTSSQVSIDQSTTTHQSGNGVAPTPAETSLTIQQSQSTSQTTAGSTDSTQPTAGQTATNTVPAATTNGDVSPEAAQLLVPTNETTPSQMLLPTASVPVDDSPTTLVPISAAAIHHTTSTVHSRNWQEVYVSEASTAPAVVLEQPAPVGQPIKSTPAAPLPLPSGYLSALMAAFGSAVTPVVSLSSQVGLAARHDATLVVITSLYLSVVLFWLGLNVLMRRTGYARAPRGSLEPAHIFATSLLMSYVGPPRRMQHSSFLVVSDTK